MRVSTLFSVRTGVALVLGLATTVAVALIGALWSDPGWINAADSQSFYAGEGSSYVFWQAEGPLWHRCEGKASPRNELEEWAARANTQFERHGIRNDRFAQLRRSPILLIDADADFAAAEAFVPGYFALPDARRIDAETWRSSFAVGWPWRSFVRQGRGLSLDPMIAGMPIDRVKFVREHGVLLVQTPWEDADRPYRAIREVPLRPMPAGLALNTLCYGAAWWVLLGVPLVVRSWVRVRAHRCGSCGYDRAGIGPGSACPECGRAPRSTLARA